MVDGRFADFVRGIDFELIRPGMRRGSDGRFTIERKSGPNATVLELPGVPMDLLNTRLSADAAGLHRALRPICDIPRLESFAIGATLNRGVECLRPDEAFVNVGVWNGYSFLAGLHGNPDRRCIGIDNFSGLGGPRGPFLARFEERKGPAHEFFEMGYEEYFSTRHEGPIGLYFYDGLHSYQHQLRGLQIAEPFFTDDCVVLVDDSNLPEPYDATFDFIGKSEREYEVLLDERTAGLFHPTWWNGFIVLKATGRARSGDPPAGYPRRQMRPPLDSNPIDFDSRSTLVSLIVCSAEDDGPALESTIDLALGQTWPAVEVIVASNSGNRALDKAVRTFGSRITSVVGDDQVRAGLEASSGPIVAFLDAQEPALEETSVELGLALPELSRFNRGSVEGSRAHLLRCAFEAPADIAGVIPADASFVLAGTDELTSAMIDTQRAMSLFGPGVRMPALDGPGAIARLDELRGAGARFAVFLLGTFSWLAARPELEDHLRTTGRPVLENDRARVFALGQPSLD